MYIAWQHNPNGEFHDAGVVQWGAWLAVGLFWLVPVGAVTTLGTRALLAVVAPPGDDGPTNRGAAL
jgi:hypothetical protein